MYAVYTTYTAHITIPSVYAGDAPDALNEVRAYRNPFPTRSGPSLLPGRRHHVYNPTPTYDATTRLLQIAVPCGSTSTGLRETAHAVRAVATAPPTPTASRTNTRASARRRPTTLAETAVVVTRGPNVRRTSPELIGDTRRRQARWRVPSGVGGRHGRLPDAVGGVVAARLPLARPPTTAWEEPAMATNAMTLVGLDVHA